MRKIFKRFTTIILGVAMVTSMVACGSVEEDKKVEKEDTVKIEAEELMTNFLSVDDIQKQGEYNLLISGDIAFDTDKMLKDEGYNEQDIAGIYDSGEFTSKNIVFDMDSNIQFTEDKSKIKCDFDIDIFGSKEDTFTEVYTDIDKDMINTYTYNDLAKAWVRSTQEYNEEDFEGLKDINKAIKEYEVIEEKDNITKIKAKLSLDILENLDTSSLYEDLELDEESYKEMIEIVDSLEAELVFDNEKSKLLEVNIDLIDALREYLVSIEEISDYLQYISINHLYIKIENKDTKDISIEIPEQALGAEEEISFNDIEIE